MNEEKGFLDIRFNKHRRRQNNILVAGMYEMYKNSNDGAGCSLKEVGRVYNRSRQAVYDIFKSRSYPLRSKQLKGATLWKGVRYTFDGAGFLRGTRSGRREYLHKAVWEQANGSVPAKHFIHHRDGNKTNNDLSNLEMLSMSQMSAIFNPEHHNQFTKSEAA